MKKIAVFKLAEQYYAFDINHINEIIKMQPVTQIPNSAEHIEGIAILRGNICTLLSGRVLLAMEKTELTDEQFIIVLDNRKIGIVVDEVSEIIDIEDGELQPFEAVKNIENLLERDDKVICILNFEEILEGLKTGFASMTLKVGA